MILSFALSMPNVGSWNGKWTGEGTLYAKVINFGRSQKANDKAREILAQGYYRYDFGDGWSAGVSVKAVSPKEATSIRRKSKGFCNYDWMVDSIRLDGKIIAPSDRVKMKEG